MPTIFRYVSASTLTFLLAIGLLSGFALSGFDQVPFHPDEATQLYNSLDFDLLITAPRSMAWHPETARHLRETDRRLYYRLLDAPITRYFLGLGRRLAGQAVTTQDWDWSETWEANQQQGALPTPALLHTGRLTITLLLPCSLVLVYLIGRQTASPLLGLLAMLFFGLNALTLLHARRAMAEGALVFGTAFAIWSFLQADRRPWLAGLGIAVVVNAKQTGLLLLPVGLLAILWTTTDRSRLGSKMLWYIVQYGGVFLLVSMALNPFIWRYPVQAVQASWQMRQALSAGQVRDAEALTGQTLGSPTERAMTMLVNLYIAPPAFAEYGNYRLQTQAAEQNYLTNPAHRLLRGIGGGAVLFGLTLFGVTLALQRLPRATRVERRSLVLLLLSTLVLFLGLAWLIELSWQRYVIPLVPLIAIWQAYGLAGPSAFHARGKPAVVAQPKSP